MLLGIIIPNMVEHRTICETINQLLTTPIRFQWMQPCHRDADLGTTGCSKVKICV